MTGGKPSHTAERVALRRAAHQVFDHPIVFHDSLALRILGLTDNDVRSGRLRAPRRATSRSLRALLVARAVFAEEALAAAVAQGCTQYVLLGAGLDTFAFRNENRQLRVFEVDHPATQAWKQDLLRAHGIGTAANCTFVPVDFESDALLEQLLSSGFRKEEPATFAWLGVLPYLTLSAMRATLADLAALPATLDLLLDYSLPRSLLSPEEQLRFDSLSARVSQAGEPFQLFFSPAEMAAELERAHFHVVEDLDADAMNLRYYHGRADGLQVLGTANHLLHARTCQQKI